MSSLSYFANTDDTSQLKFDTEPICPPFPELQSHTIVKPGIKPTDLNGVIGAPGMVVINNPYTIVGGKLSLYWEHMEWATVKALYIKFLEGKNLFFYDATKTEDRYWIGTLEPPKFTSKPGANRGDETSFTCNVDFTISAPCANFT